MDVGQGDCTLIITPNHKNILIDGGTTTNTNYDVGKQTLLPYLLNHKIRTIDVMVITHFDADHCNALGIILEEITVKKVLITKQSEITEEFKNIVNIINKKKISLQVIKKGNSINLYKALEISILYPNNKLEFTDLNNNSAVMKIQYGKFSMLLTGDIEKEAEEKLLQTYDGTSVLKSIVLKIPHHGSKTSSTQNFLEQVKPQIALIGVGKNNIFGHPNEEILERLESLRCKNI